MKKGNCMAWAIIFFGVLIFKALTPGVAAAATLTVPDDHPTIQQAIDAAGSADTVLVRAGTYFEHLVIGKPLTLQGEESAAVTIDGNGSGNVIYLSTGNVTIRGVTIANGDRGVEKQLSPSWNVHIEDCIFSGNARALHGHFFYDSIIEDCDIADNGHGIDVGWGANVYITGNRIHDNSGRGIHLDSMRNAFVENNTVEGNSVGISIGYRASFNTIRDNIVKNNGLGIQLGALQGSGHNRVYHNDIIENTVQAQNERPDDVWDDGYPSGGNYWSDYADEDLFGGPGQDILGSDGFGDTPYPVPAPPTCPGCTPLRDNYPRMTPWHVANYPPVADAGADQTVEQESCEGTTVTLDGSGSTDPDASSGTHDDIVSFGWYEGETFLGSGETLVHLFPLGTHIITLVVTDSSGSADDDQVTIVVEDTTPPQLALSLGKDSLWPPNHDMIDVGFGVEVLDPCNPAAEALVEVTSDEPTATAPHAGGPNHAPDARITDDGSILLRAERSGEWDGRVYEIKARAVDAFGNSASSRVTVTVSHSRKKDAIDSGQLYDATEIN